MRVALCVWMGLFSVAMLLGCNTTRHAEDPAMAVVDSVTARTVEIINANGDKIGKALLTQEKTGVRLHVQVNGLSPGKHGFHIHEKAFEGTDFQSAGGHFNPTGAQHGLKNPQGAHVGDMRNLVVKPDGSAKQTEFLVKASLSKSNEYSLLGKSIIIHAGEDDQVTDPSGNSGDRIAGGIIGDK
ncbi:superoxide dismutase family protein [Ammoniphilus sp. YIM 78166]|uniref:superoxide dismutase family protein n=1 Tax=Ammoniphilus sp. YIM 78166 TaxID=1644106 RepID=UPI001070692F|nr:superoxide dismutase family protein [Ammoniphilus sp. YIM 78166]